MENYAYRYFLIIVMMCFTTNLRAQNTENLQDTLTASVKTGFRKRESDAGVRIITPREIRSVISVTGTPDVIKYVQLLPGVSTGAEGSSAVFVRGGNIGSNLLSIDNVPLFGSTHLLGLASVFPSEFIGETEFMVGGFTSEEGNLTASHIKLKSGEGSFNGLKTSASISNFLAGAQVSVPIIKDKLSFSVGGRISPIQLEYNAFRKHIKNGNEKIGPIQALVYDIYGKLEYKFNSRHKINLSIFRSLDNYSIVMNGDSEDKMNWSNFIVNLLYDGELGKAWSLHGNVSSNSFHNGQGMRKIFYGSENNLMIQSSIDEWTGNLLAKKHFGEFWDFQCGLKLRHAIFNPASANEYSGNGLAFAKYYPLTDNFSKSITVTAHTQLELKKHKHYNFRLAFRYNMNSFNSEKLPEEKKTNYDPETSILARIHVNDYLGVEGTADWLTQYYHTLEGMPLGWSLDMIIPSDASFAPEKSTQYYAGAFLTFGGHRLSVGAYTKSMKDLIYFTDAKLLFSSSAAGWRSRIDIGSGNSKGIECQYEVHSDKIDAHLAYTLSKTNRVFSKLNFGKPFNAKFDRRHIVNASLSYVFYSSNNAQLNLNTLFTYQSGHWETVPSAYFSHTIMTGEEQEIKYFNGVNNYSMPPFIRWDIGLSITISCARLKHEIDLGIYNVLNRHNTFSVTFDTKENKWKKMYLFPIMPSLRYKVEF